VKSGGRKNSPAISPVCANVNWSWSLPFSNSTGTSAVSQAPSRPVWGSPVLRTAPSARSCGSTACLSFSGGAACFIRGLNIPASAS